MSEVHPTEVFLPVPEFPAYRVSNQGRVMTCIHPNGWKGMTDKWRPLKPFLTRYGYHEVTLRKDMKSHKKVIHRLVLEAFVGPCPEGMEARHVDDNNRINNNLTNLCWGTVQDNADDRVRHGTQVRGTTCKQSKLTEEDVREMRRLRREGWGMTSIARKFGMHRRRTYRIVLGESWKHVE